jgi:DNA-binding NarL/FixJ family response regulator
MMKDLTFLIVEDDEVTKGVIRKTLLELDYKNILTCNNGFDAIDIVRKDHIHICIMDIELNDVLDGVDTAKLIGSSAKVIFTSALEESDVFERINKANNYGFLPKPITAKMLQQCIELAMSATH